MRPCRPAAPRPSRRAVARRALAPLLALALSLVVASCGRQSDRPPAELAGCWESSDHSGGSVGNTIELLADGRAAYTLGAIVDGRYRVAGDTLVVTIGDTSMGGPQTRATAFALAGDSLHVTAPDGVQRQALARVDGGEGLTGTWGYAHPAGATAYETYTADGRFLFRLPMQTLTGRWTVANDSLELALDGERPRRAAFARERETLVVTDASGIPLIYVPADPALPAVARRGPDRSRPLQPGDPGQPAP